MEDRVLFNNLYSFRFLPQTPYGNVQKWVSVCNVASHRICDSKEGFSQQKSWMLSIWLLLKSPLIIYIWSLAFIQIYYEQVGKKNENWLTSPNHVISTASFVLTQTPNFPVQFLWQISFYNFYKKCSETFILACSFKGVSIYKPYFIFVVI